MSSSHCEIVEEAKITDVLVIEPPSYQRDPIIFNRQNIKKTWTTRYSKRRIMCHHCNRKFSGDCDILMHIKAKHTPKTLLTLSLKCLSLLMNMTAKQCNPPKSLINPTGLPVCRIQREPQVIEAPTKDFQEDSVSKSAGCNINLKKSWTNKYSTESLHASMEEDIELVNSLSTKNNKNNTIIRAKRYEPSEGCRKEGLENHMRVEQNRNTDMQIIPKPSSNQGVEAVAVKQIPPECNAGIKREIDENNSNDNSVARVVISAGVKMFAPISNKMGNEGNYKTGSDEPSMKPLSNDYHSVLPTLNFSVGCNICNKYFKNDYFLLNHMKICHVAHRCQWCGYIFSSRFWLTNHLASIHNIKISHDTGRRSNVALNSNRGYRRSKVMSNAKAQRTFSNVKFEPAYPNVKYEPAFPDVKFEPAFPNFKVEPVHSNVKIEPILIKVEPNIDQ